MSKNQCLAVGVDVSKTELVVCFRSEEGRNQVSSFPNTVGGIKQIIQQLQRCEFIGKLIMESTGRYHLLAAILLSEAKLDVRIINPLLTKKYSTGSIRKVKTDKQDSCLLAQMALQETRLPDTFSSDRTTVMLKKKINLISSLEKQLQPLHAIMKDYQYAADNMDTKLSPAEQGLLETILQLEKQKEQLIAEVENIARQQPPAYLAAADEQINRLSSIPGVSTYMASLAAIFFSNTATHSKQWIAYAGMDVSVRQSGSWQGKGKLTKRGSRYLRKRLFSAAWGAMMHNDEFKRYYHYLKTQGRSYTESMVIIARKIIKIMFYLTKTQTNFNPQKPIFAAV